jgi:hypothetical protein
MAFKLRSLALAAIGQAALFVAFPQAASACSADGYMGEICITAANYCPQNYVNANGQTLSITQYLPLFNLLGTRYGGDGRSTFALPKVTMSADKNIPLTACIAVQGEFPLKAD